MTTLNSFDQIETDTVDRWLADGQQEHAYLDFKTLASPDFSSRDDRKNFAIAVTGFANGDGGIVAWGIRTSRNDGVDRASSIVPLERPDVLIGRLHELTASACSPPVPGVRHKLVAARDGQIAISWVPRSDLAPHMACAGEDRFYRRAGSSFRVMEAYEIRDLLQRAASPVLELRLTLLSGGTVGGGGTTRHHVKGIVAIANVGRASARAPFLELEPNAPHTVHPYGIDGNGSFGLARQVHVGAIQMRRFAGDGTTYLHPGVVLDVASIDMVVVESQSGAVTHPRELSAVCHLAAERYPLTRFVLEASSHDIMVAAGKAGRAPG